MGKNLEMIVDKCKVKVYILEQKKETSVFIDIEKRPAQKDWLGKKVGDTYKLSNMCDVLNISRRTYYKYRNSEDKDYYDYLIIKEIFEVRLFKDLGKYADGAKFFV